MSLSNLPIAITGASSGIGAATAIACAKAGMPVALAARREDKLRDVADIITKSGGKAITIACDVSKKEDCERLVAETVRAFGFIYCVFANAGYGGGKSAIDMPEADIRAMFETNFWGSLHLALAAMPYLLKNDPLGPRMHRGHILFCSSCLSKIGVPKYSAYCASKAMQDHYARSMRHELRDSQVAVSSVHPIGTRTEFFDQAKKRGAELIDMTPDKSMQSPTVVANAILRCLKKPHGEVWTSPMTRFTLGLATIMPDTADWVLHKLYKKRARSTASPTVP